MRTKYMYIQANNTQLEGALNAHCAGGWVLYKVYLLPDRYAEKGMWGIIFMKVEYDTP